MIICKNVLSKSDLDSINLSDWDQGQSALGTSHKDNQEIKNHPLSEMIKDRILRHPKVRQYSFIKYMTNPRFNKYTDSGKYNDHVDFFTQEGIRTDWSMTLFLSHPDSYEGGELVVDEKEIKLPAGSMVLYPSGRIHRVNPVTKGERIAAIAWAQSYVASHEDREILCKLTELMQKYTTDVDLSFVYNNLLRKWST